MTKWTGLIGLISPSDYGYATSGGSSANRESCLNTNLDIWNSTGITDCKNNDWLYKSETYHWTISPSAASDAYYVYAIHSAGYIYISSSMQNNNVFPALYLNSNVKILDDGSDGSSANPFKLSID